MVKSIESYISETTKSYDPSIKAINTQLSGLGTSKASDLANLERSYASQQETLERKKNQAAETASLAAAARGGAFGGASNIARRNYYNNTFVPAVTQLNSDKATAQENLNKDYNERQSSLESQLANLYSQANTYGMQRYDDALKQEEATRQFNEQLRQREAAEQEAIRQYNENLAMQKTQQAEAIRQYNENLALQKAQQEEAIRQYNLNLELEKQKLAESKRQSQASLAAQSAAARATSYLPNYSTQTASTKSWDFGGGYGIADDGYGNAVYYKNGGKDRISAGEFLENAIGKGGHHQWDNWNDIWNSGVRTNGVGSDTVSIFRQGMSSDPLSQYSYLRRIY